MTTFLAIYNINKRVTTDQVGWKCQPVVTDQCVSYGEPHIKTPDGAPCSKLDPPPLFNSHTQVISYDS